MEPEDPRRAYLRRTFARLSYEKRQFLREVMDFLDERDLDRVLSLLRPLLTDVLYNEDNGRQLDRRGDN